MAPCTGFDAVTRGPGPIMPCWALGGVMRSGMSETVVQQA